MEIEIEKVELPKTPEAIRAYLDGFYCSEEFYRNHLVSNVIYTQGMQAMAEVCQAYWLIDVAATNLRHAVLKSGRNPFFIGKLKRNDKGGATFSYRLDSRKRFITSQYIPYTDFPLDVFEFYACDNGNGYTLLLKSEY